MSLLGDPTTAQKRFAFFWTVLVALSQTLESSHQPSPLPRGETIWLEVGDITHVSVGIILGRERG